MHNVRTSQNSDDFRQVVFCENTYDLTPPRVFQDVELVDVKSTMTSNPVQVIGTKHAKVWFDGINAVIFDENGQRVSTTGSEIKCDFPEVPSQHIPGVSLLLATAGAECYYHWMLELLPKIRALEEAGVRLQDIDNVLLRMCVRPFQLDSMKALGIDSSKITLIADRPDYTCDYVYAVECPSFLGMKMHHFAPEYLRACFLPNYQTTKLPNYQTTKTLSSEKSFLSKLTKFFKRGKSEPVQRLSERKLYIARQDRFPRKILNEKLLRQLLVKNGFEVLYLEGRSIEKQAELFNEATTIVTSHGAALANLVFCRPGTQVIELFGAHAFSFYYGLANLCGLDYTAIFKEPDQYGPTVDPLIGSQKESRFTTIGEDSEVNLEALSRALESLNK